MFETRITDSHDGKKYPLSLHTFLDISYDFGDSSSNGWKTLYIGNGTYDNHGNENNPVFETFRLYGLQTTDYSNNTGYSIAFNSKPDPINTPLPSFDQSANPFDLRLYGVNQSGQVPNYVYLYGISLEPTGAPGPVEVTNTRDFQQNQFTMDLSFALNSLNPSTTTGIDITQYDVSFHMVESKRFASADPIDHSGVYQIVWDGISGLSNTEIDLSHLYPGAKYDIMVRAQNRGLAGVDGSYGDTAFTSTDFTNVGATQYITLNDLEPVNPQGMTFTLVNSASIRCCISGNNTLANKTIMNSNGEIDISGTSDFYVNFGKQGLDMSGAGVLVNARFSRIVNGVESPVVVIPFTSSENDSSYSFLGYVFEKGSYVDKAISSTFSDGFVYGSSIHMNGDVDNNSIFNTYFEASTKSFNLKYSIIGTSSIDGSNNNRTESNVGDNFHVDNFDLCSNTIVNFVSEPQLTAASFTTLFGIPSIQSVQLNATVLISNFANFVIPHDSSNTHSFISEISNNSYSFPLHKHGSIVFTPGGYTISYAKTTDISAANGTYEVSGGDFITSVHYLDHSNDSPSFATYEHHHQLDLGNKKIFKDTNTSYTSLPSLPLYTFDESTIGSTQLNTSDPINNYTLLYFNGGFVSGGYNTPYNGTVIYPFQDWGDGYLINGPNYTNYADEGYSSGYKWIAIDVTSRISFMESIHISSILLNNATLNTNQFGISYEAYIMKRDANGVDTYGTLNKKFNICAMPWYNQQWTNIKASNEGNGVVYNGEVIIDKTSLRTSSYFLIVGLPLKSSDIFTFI